MTPKEVLEFAKKNDVAKQLDLRFTDLPGLQQHVLLSHQPADEELVRRRLRHRRLQHPRLGAPSTKATCC